MPNPRAPKPLTLEQVKNDLQSSRKSPTGGAAFGVYPRAGRRGQMPSGYNESVFDPNLGADQRAMSLPEFGEIDLDIPTASNRAMGQRMTERQADLKRQADQDMSPLEKLAGAMQAARLMGSGLTQAVKSIPTAVTKGGKAAEEYIAENIYKPTQPKAYEYTGDVGDFLTRLETDYKIPPIMPEAVALQSLIGPATRQAKRAAGQAARQGAANLAAPRTLGSQAGAVVYHGSPHKFDKFSPKKIGTGEGSQAYGHGLYFAQSPDVAKTYQPRSPQFEEKLIKLYEKASSAGNYPMMEVLEDAMLHKTPDEIVKKFANTDDGYTGQHAKAAKDFVNWYSKNEPEVGGLYTVDLPDEKISRMLDYDKPLSAQHPDVQKALLEHPDILDYMAKAEAQRTKLNEMSPVRLEKIPSASVPYDASRMAGKDVMTAIAQRSGLGGEQGAIEEQLRQLGIPGIRYLDEQSRGATGTGRYKIKLPSGEEKIYDFKPNDDAIKMMNATIEPYGNQNFVVFPGEEDALTILDRKKEGGSIHFSDNPDTMRLELAGGGLIKKGIKAAAKAVKGTQDVLPAAERDANLAKFLEKSAVKNRVYHGTNADFSKFDPVKLGGATNARTTGLGFFSTDNELVANRFADSQSGANVMPLHVNIQNPLEIGHRTAKERSSGKDPFVAMQEAITKIAGKKSWNDVTPEDVAVWKDRLVNRGYDGIVLRKTIMDGAGGATARTIDDPYHDFYIAFQPEQMKSAIGNRGTYDINEPDLRKAVGGAVRMQVGGAMRAAKAASKPIVKAPAIVMPSGLSQLKEAIRQSKGDYGARRVERAADEIPNLERLYNEQALREAFGGDNAKALMTMNPADFEKYAVELKGRTPADIGPKMTELAKQGEIDKYTVPTDEYIQHLMRVQGGFDDVPYLNLFKDEVGLPSYPEVRGHEGRHRSRALSEAGEPSSLVRISPRGDLYEGLPRGSQEEYIEALREELERSNRLVLPERDGSYRRPPIELPDPYAAGGAVRMSGGGALAKLGAKGAAKGAKEAAVPLSLPRVRPSTKDILEAAERVGKQQAGEFVKSPLLKETTNLAGRSKKEVERLKALEYKTTPIKDLPEMKPYEAKVGEVNVALPGDQTISDMLLESIDDIPVGTTAEGGALFGRGRLADPEESRAFWASNIGPADIFQRKVTELAKLYDTDMITAYHLAMGQTANNFAQHLADANMRAIDFSKLDKKKMNAFDSEIANGFYKKDKNTGKVIWTQFPDWPGIANPQEALDAMKENPELRKWFNNRAKTETLTKKLDLPYGKAIEWAMSEPELRNMEINLTGLSAGRMQPGAELIPESAHQTYSHDIPGTALGKAPELAPFSISFPDATSFVREKYRPQDFTGTIQKVFPHQVVDEAYLEDMNKYYTQLRNVRGFNKGGAVSYADGGEITADDLILEERKL